MQLNVGDLVEGKITGIKDYGLFVDIGEGKSGMVHISEVANTFVNDIKQFVNEGDTVKMKVINITEDGKISLSIKRAQEQERPQRRQGQERRERRPYQPSKPDNSFVWTAKKSEPASFEEMMNQFKLSSDEKFSDLKRKNPETRRSKRGAGTK